MHSTLVTAWCSCSSCLKALVQGYITLTSVGSQAVVPCRDVLIRPPLLPAPLKVANVVDCLTFTSVIMPFELLWYCLAIFVPQLDFSSVPSRKKKKMSAEGEASAVDYDRLLYRCPIAEPISSDCPKLTKKLYSLIRKAVQADKKRGIVKGIKDVTKVIRKRKFKKAVVVFGADISPFDVVSHLPVMLEEANIPYVWVPSRHDLGMATMCKRATSVVLLKPQAETEASYDKCVAAIEELVKSRE